MKSAIEVLRGYSALKLLGMLLAIVLPYAMGAGAVSFIDTISHLPFWVQASVWFGGWYLSTRLILWFGRVIALIGLEMLE